MGLLQEAFRDAKYAGLNLLGKPFGVTILPKYQIGSMAGGEHVKLPMGSSMETSDEKEMFLFVDVAGVNAPVRLVDIVEKKGVRKTFREIVGPGQEGEHLTVYKR